MRKIKKGRTFSFEELVSRGFVVLKEIRNHILVFKRADDPRLIEWDLSTNKIVDVR